MLPTGNRTPVKLAVRRRTHARVPVRHDLAGHVDDETFRALAYRLGRNGPAVLHRAAGIGVAPATRRVMRAGWDGGRLDHTGSAENQEERMQAMPHGCGRGRNESRFSFTCNWMRHKNLHFGIMAFAFPALERSSLYGTRSNQPQTRSGAGQETRIRFISRCVLPPKPADAPACLGPGWWPDSPRRASDSPPVSRQRKHL